MKSTTYEIITRKDALSQGLKQYFTGKPCKNGHVDSRYVTSGLCRGCNADSKRKVKWAVSEKGRASSKKRQSTYRARVSERENTPFTQWYWSEHPQAKIHSRLNVRISSAFKRGRASKSKTTAELLSCSIAEAIDNLEAQFLPGMTWDNHGEWHIDHIRPCASFDLTDAAQQRKCFHYTNLQPLWAKDNRIKSDKWKEVA